MFKFLFKSTMVDWNSVVSIATCHVLDSPGSESHPASYTMGTGSLSHGQSGQGMALITTLHLMLRLTGPSGQVIEGTLPLPFQVSC